MKKHLIAAAVVAAVAAPAFAQNVSISGRIDAGYSMQSTTTEEVKTDKDLITTGRFTTQRLTLSGSEDLGGGLKASFVMESTLGAASTLSWGDRAFNATLSGGFGSLMVGRSDSMVKSVFDAYDAGYSNNMVGAADGIVSAGGATASSVSVGSRDVTVRYTTPSFSGFTAAVGVMKNTTKETDEDTVEAGTGEEFGLRYTAGAFGAALAYRSVETKTNVDDKTLGLGVTYNFGPAVVFGQYFDIENKDKDVDAKIEDRFYAIGVRVPLGATTLFASYTDGERKYDGEKYDRDGYQVGVKYDLSKRTYVYLAHGDQETKEDGYKDKADETAFGLVHLF